MSEKEKKTVSFILNACNFAITVAVPDDIPLYQAQMSIERAMQTIVAKQLCAMVGETYHPYGQLMTAIDYEQLIKATISLIEEQVESKQ